jgi:hypothetical protein
MFLGPIASSAGQEQTVDVTFRQTPARAAIEQLAQSLGKSVAFDIKFRDRTIDFDAKEVTRAEALRRLLDANDLFSVDVEGVLVVAPDTLEVRGDYSARRIEACRVPSHGSVKSDIVFQLTPGDEILKALTTSLGLAAVFAPGSETAHRQYSVELRGISREAAIRVLCLALHISVRANRHELVFGGPTAG